MWIVLTQILLFFKITGLETNVNFLIDLASHPAFQAADVHTGFIPQHFESLFPPLKLDDDVLCQAVVAVICNENNAILQNALLLGEHKNPFLTEHNARFNYQATREINLKYQDKGEVFEEKLNIIILGLTSSS
jgi:3-methylcrotonyl-CoA carboxylase alpha subunit